jgi:hypothetical protein
VLLTIIQGFPSLDGPCYGLFLFGCLFIFSQRVKCRGSVNVYMVSSLEAKLLCILLGMYFYLRWSKVTARNSCPCAFTPQGSQLPAWAWSLTSLVASYAHGLEKTCNCAAVRVIVRFLISSFGFMVLDSWPDWTNEDTGVDLVIYITLALATIKSPWLWLLSNHPWLWQYCGCIYHKRILTATTTNFVCMCICNT